MKNSFFVNPLDNFRYVLDRSVMSDRLAKDQDSFHMIFRGIQQSAIQVRENNHDFPFLKGLVGGIGKAYKANSERHNRQLHAFCPNHFPGARNILCVVLVVAVLVIKKLVPDAIVAWVFTFSISNYFLRSR